MIKENVTILNNENLVISFMAYLNCKDLSRLSQVSKSLNKIASLNFDYKWRQECNDFFFSPDFQE